MGTRLRRQLPAAASTFSCAALLLSSMLAVAHADTNGDVNLPLASDPSPASLRGDPAALEEIVITAPEPRYVAPTTRDRIGRIWAPVSINGRGPYRLVLDTGASRSAVTQQVVDELRLTVREGTARLRGVTGTSIAATVQVDTLEVGELLLEDSTLPIVPDAFGGAQGVLGGEGLKEKRIVIEFKKDRISIARSNRVPASVDFSVVPFKYAPTRGMRVDVRVGSVRAIGLIDTGGQVTIGNLALRDALVRRHHDDAKFEDQIIGITADIQKATRMQIPSIVAGQMIVRNAQISFGDLYIFDHWQLHSRPALLIGMDVLGALDTLIIDYRRNELQIKIPQ
jgi:hypothetical protein